ncbi:hypothetical protein ACWDZ8_20780 [Streptomyces sp. NPDC003233]
MSTPPDFGTAPIDQAFGVATGDLPQRIALLDRLTQRITRSAKDTPTAAAKAYDPACPSPPGSGSTVPGRRRRTPAPCC